MDYKIFSISNKISLSKCIFTFFLLLISINSIAQVKTWTGNGFGNSWSDANNWSPVGVPGSSHVAYIGSDSVRATGDILIRGLVLDGNAILNYQTTSSFEFIIDETNNDGIILRSNAKLYVNSKMTLRNINHTGVLMEASNYLFIGDFGSLIIEDTGEDGIYGVLTSSVENHGVINIESFQDDGLAICNLLNTGSITVSDDGTRAAIIGGSTSENQGQINFGSNVLLNSTVTFTNQAAASIYSSGPIQVYGDLVNHGTIASESTEESIKLYSYAELDNYGEISFTYSNENNIELNGNSELINHSTGLIHNLDSMATAMEGVFAISLKDAGTSIENDGEIALDLNNAREGIEIFDGGVLTNSGLIDIQNYYKSGVVLSSISSDKETILNYKTAAFNIGEGALSSSKALVLEDGNILNNRECSDFVLEDSLELNGTSGTLIYNYGFMQIEGLKKDAGPDFINTGALALTSSLLENGLPAGYINQFGNGGLIYSKNPNEIMEGQQVQPLFAGFHSDAAAYLSNIQVKENGAMVPAGDLDAPNNYWKPNEAAVREDTVYITYTLDECNARVLKLPFYRNPVWDCNTAPAANVTFLGSINTDWHTSDNWSNNEVPRACDKVIIPNGERCEIAPTTTAEAKSILVETGAYFLAPPGVMVLFDPSE
ncbi:hypothetical protein [uncultured Arcticibacterium sp.]|uniref:hypothetical protein n=1 Tax=uncultured Arcticibacterium sp. TaxID=2173042 RepID=UPI0030FBD603